MSASHKAAPFELTGISGTLTAQYSFEFHGKTYIADDKYGEIAEFYDGSLLEDDSYDGLPHHTTAETDEAAGHGHPTTAFNGPFTAGTYYIAGSYADSNASMQMNRPYPTSASLSQVSGFFPTPSTSETGSINYNPQPDDLVSSSNWYYSQHSMLQSLAENNSSATLKAWYDDQRHESLACRLAKTAAEPPVKEKKPTKKSHKAHKHK
jgi:hypothetical protein